MITHRAYRDIRRDSRYFRCIAPVLGLLAWLSAGPVLAAEAMQDSDLDRAFRRDAQFMIGDDVHTTVSAVAWIEEHPAFGAGYHLLTIGFYPFELTRQQIAAAAAGNYQPIEDRTTADTRSADYKSHVMVSLSLYEGDKVGFVNISVPGSFCTVTPFQDQVEGFLQAYLFEGGRLRLKSRGSHACFATNPNIPDKTYRWDFDVDLPVFEFGAP